MIPSKELHPTLVLGAKKKEPTLLDLTPQVTDERRQFSCKVLSDATINQVFRD